MKPNLAAGNMTRADMVTRSMHGIAEVDRDADAHVERHCKDLNVEPTRAGFDRKHPAFGVDDASSHRHIVVVAFHFGIEGEFQCQDIATLVATVPTVPFAADVISPRNASEAKASDRDGGHGVEADVAQDRDFDRVEGDVQEPVEAVVESLVRYVVEKGSDGGGGFFAEGQLCALKGGHVLDLPSEQQAQGYAHARYAGRGFWVDGGVEVLGDLHGAVQGTRGEADQDHFEKLRDCEDSLGRGGR
jgi:hypothetical protein